MSNRRVILIIGPKDEETISVARELKALSSEISQIECISPRAEIELIVRRNEIVWRISSELEISQAVGRKLQRKDWPIAAVYVRTLSPLPQFPEDSPQWTYSTALRSAFYDTEIYTVKSALLRHLQESGVPVYNAVSGSEMELKPFRLARMAELGLPFPDTLFTQNPRSATAFVNSYDAAIVKPVRGGMRTVKLTPQDLDPERLNRLAVAPVTFQKLAPGSDVRVFLCDGEILGGIQIFSDKEVDSRGFEKRVEAFPVPEVMAEQCVSFCASIGLRFAGIDLRVSSDGRHEFLEFNNAPMFALTADRILGGAVARGLAKHLAKWA